jgi:hypothetical protein
MHRLAVRFILLLQVLAAVTPSIAIIAPPIPPEVISMAASRASAAHASKSSASLASAASAEAKSTPAKSIAPSVTSSGGCPGGPTVLPQGFGRIERILMRCQKPGDKEIEKQSWGDHLAIATNANQWTPGGNWESAMDFYMGSGCNTSPYAHIKPKSSFY